MTIFICLKNKSPFRGFYRMPYELVVPRLLPTDGWEYLEQLIAVLLLIKV
ncbi:MAG: hypothetical protein UT41_C0002G0036 [Candidatus Wolfebacteria bacterium GW2011_GWC2_39_22]|uniref:Uncharacterized protein n=1 Tax=Candidatus Wolfebacteria bacterium GW2011_GWC2_39_22 TaxID=1619013 RepID=A0A0G0RF33_9BACT|nr:MAG: hypothetical protein UT41_C0002G0036 [Candidatus Wolfebacteria bacterium GW2011_GWC2_39_22]